MKKSILIFKTLFITSFVFSGCGDKQKETTTEIKDSIAANETAVENVGTVESTDKSMSTKDGTYCYESKRKEGGKSFTCPLTLVIKEGKVTATSPGDGYCGANYEGYQKDDTLFLKGDYEEPDGATVKVESLWLLKEDKLSAFETFLDKNGKSVLKNPEKPVFVYVYNKVNCK